MLRIIWLALLLAGVLALSSVEVRAQSSQTSVDGLAEHIEQARQALLADEYAESLALIQKAVARPDFPRADLSMQYLTLLIGSYAAASVGDHLTAHEFQVAATRFPQVDGAMWIGRATSEQALERWEDAAQSLNTVAKKWPQALKPEDYITYLVAGVVRELGQRPALHAQRHDLLDSLFKSNYQLAHGAEPATCGCCSPPTPSNGKAWIVREKLPGASPIPSRWSRCESTRDSTS